MARAVEAAEEAATAIQDGKCRTALTALITAHGEKDGASSTGAFDEMTDSMYAMEYERPARTVEAATIAFEHSCLKSGSLSGLGVEQQYNKEGFRRGEADVKWALQDIGALIREMAASGDRSKCAVLHQKVEAVAPWTPIGPQEQMNRWLKKLCAIDRQATTVLSPVFQQDEHDDPVDAAWREMKRQGMSGLGSSAEEHTVRRQARADAAATIARMTLNALEDGDCAAAFPKLLHMKELMGNARAEWEGMGGQGPMPVDPESPVRHAARAFENKCIIKRKKR